jgi:type II secretory pathway component PulC
MAQRGPAIPEEQLLKLIRNPKTKDLNQKKTKQQVFRVVSLSGLKGRLAFISQRLSGIFTGKQKFPQLNLQTGNRILKFAIVVLSFVLVINVVVSMTQLEEVPDFAVESTRSPISTPEDDLSVKKISYYLEKVRSRDLFKFGDLPSREPEPPPEEIQSPQETPLDSLVLVGIGFSDDPDVMIKDAKTDKIYFLKRGDRIEGKAKVEAIFADKVILTYQGQELELR